MGGGGVVGSEWQWEGGAIPDGLVILRNQNQMNISSCLYQCYCLSSHLTIRYQRGSHARAPYSWNMVNLFSFSCHVIDRAYVRTRLRNVRVRQERLSKEGRGVSGVSWQVHIFYFGHSQYGQLTAVKTRQPLTSIPRPYRGLMCQLIVVT